MKRSILGDVFPPTTEEIGLFEVAPELIVDWLYPEAIDSESGVPRARRSTLRFSRFSDVLEALQPLASPKSREVYFAIDGWTVLLNNSSLGTDVGIKPSRAAQQVGCRAVRAVDGKDVIDADGRNVRYAATILEVYDPASTDRMKCQRVISAANDGGRWDFTVFGEPYDFEDTSSYSRRLISDRFTPELLYRYLSHLGVPALLEERCDFDHVWLIEIG